MIAPLVEELQSRYTDINFYKLDTSLEELSGIDKELGVSALPCFKLFKGGNEVANVTGYKRKPLAEAVERLSAAPN